ncbi:MAG: ribonuclease Y [Patescibacteria group bacterium]
MIKDFVPIITFIGIIVGLLVGYYFRKFIVGRYFESLESKVKDIEEKAKRTAQEILINAKEEALKIIEEAKKEEISRRKELKLIEKKLEERRALFDKKLLEFEEEKGKLIVKAKKIEEMEKETLKKYKEAEEKLKEIAGLSTEEAKSLLLKKIEDENKEEILLRIKKLEKEKEEEIEKKAQELLVSAIERYAGKVSSERMTSVVNLPSDEIKGRIIGREGRNIRTIENLTGVEIIIDDTPGVIVISSFSPLRRVLAKKLLEKLIVDGRIQPARIERFFEETKKELAREIKEAGEEAVYKLGIVGLPQEIVQLLGRLLYRTSYGQNVLQHSIEVANLAAAIASELKADVSIVKKAGLLHDIGKAVDQEVSGTHPEIGKELAEKYNLDPEIITCIATHHQDKPPTLEAIIVKVADAISGARPGARVDTYEEYLKRLEELEKIATSFPGVEKAYAIEAGREIRVFVNTEEIDDLEATKLAKEIAKKIEKELQYPGEIRVNVIREKRIIEYAR